MYSVIEKFDWITNHIWRCSPVWFHSGNEVYAIYDKHEVELKEGRILWNWSKTQPPFDITYYALIAFRSSTSSDLVHFGYDQIETLYQEGKRCTENA